MLKSLKNKNMKSKLIWVILWGIAFLGMMAYMGGALLQRIRGPVDIATLSADELEGAYVTVDIDTLIDAYAHTVESSDGRPDRVASKEYLLPLEAGMIGVEVEPDKIDTADAIVDDTYLYLTLPEEEYEWDGSMITVTGTIRRMDEETRGYYYEALGYIVDEDFMNERCYPLVLKDGTVGNLDSGMLGFFVAVDVALLVVFVCVLVSALTGGAAKCVKAYAAAQPDPQGTMQELDDFYENTPTESGLKLSRKWLLYDHGTAGFLLAANDIIWVYQSVTQHRTNGVPTGKTYAVTVCSRSEPRSRSRHTIPVKNEQAGKELGELLMRWYPDAVYGYNAEWDRAYRADPAAFYQSIQNARAEAARRAAEQAAIQAAPDSQPDTTTL